MIEILKGGNAIVNAMATSETYYVYLYGRKIKAPEDDTPLKTLTATSIDAGDDIIEILNPGTDGYVATIINPYGMNLGYVQEHRFVRDGNFSPTLSVVNDRGAPFQAAYDLKAYKSVLVQVSRDNIDPNRVPPTSAYIYHFDPDDPRKVIFKDVSLTDKGKSIQDMINDDTHPLDLDPNTDSDHNGDSTDDNDTFLSEWDFDLSKDTSGDSNPANDSEYKTSGISEISTTINNNEVTVTWKDRFNKDNNTTIYSWQSREAGSDIYITQDINTIYSDNNLTANIDIDITKNEIIYYRFKTNDGRVSPEIKIKVLDNNIEILNKDTINNEQIYHVYSQNTKKVRVKLMTKNLVTQDYDNVVRELNILDKPEIPEIPPTALFSYKRIPKTKQVYIYNVSFGADANSTLTYSDSEYTIGNGINNKKYNFEWDFDTRTEIDKLLIQPTTGTTIDSEKHITTEGTVENGTSENIYINDSITDNDINTKFSALQNSNNNYNGMIITFPEDQKTYNVKLTVTDNSNDELSDSKTISIYIPKIPEPLPPIAAFMYSYDGNLDNISITNNSIGINGESDIENNGNYKFIWDKDLNIDFDGDGDYENDRDYTVFEPTFKYNKNGNYNAKLTIIYNGDLSQNPISDSVQRVMHVQLMDNSEITLPPIAAFTYSYDGELDNISITNNSIGINGDSNINNNLEYQFIWDKDLNADSDGDGDDENDEDYNVFEPIFKYDKNGTYNAKLTVIYNGNLSQNPISDSVVRLIHVPSIDDEDIPIKPPIAAFTYRRDPNDDKTIEFINKATDSNGDPIDNKNVIWDFDISYDSNGDGNTGNDDDKINDDNESFTVNAINSPGEIIVKYKNYKIYRVKQTVTENNRSDYVIRKIKLFPISTQLPPLPLFIYSKDGETITFVNKSQDSDGNYLTEDNACTTDQEPIINNCYKYSWFFTAESHNSGTPDYIGFGSKLQHTYDGIGRYNVYLQIDSPSGDQETMSRSITIADNTTISTINANIVATPKSGTAPLTVVFTSEGSKDELGSINSIYWDFDGDGNPDEHSDVSGDSYTTVSHTYPSPGHYRAGLAVKGPSGKAVTFTWIDIYGEKPKAKIFIDKDEFANEDTSSDYINFINNKIDFKAFVEDTNNFPTSDNYIYKWDFGDSYYSPENNQSTQINAAHIYTNPGTYKVSFYVKNTISNLTNTVTRNIKIYPAPPEAKIIANSLDHTIVSDSDQKFFAGTLDLSNNRFDVEFLATDSVGAPITSDVNSETTKLKTFSWDFGDGNNTTEISKDTPVIHGFTKPGTYNVVLTITDEKDITNKTTKIVFISDNREPVPYIKIKPPRAKTGQLITLDATGSHSTNGPIVEYTWEIGQRPFTQTNPGIKLFSKISRYSFEKPSLSDDPYDVALTIKDNIGKVQTVYLDDVLVIDSKPPTAKLTFTKDDINVPNKILFDASRSFDDDPDDTLTYTWYFGDDTAPVTTSIPITSHIYGEKGRFFARVEVTDSANLKNTAEVVVRITSLLRADITEIVPRAGKAPLDVSFNGTGGYTRILNDNISIDDTVVVNYEWDFDDGTIINGRDQTMPTHTFVDGGKYNVKLTVSDIEDESASYKKIVYVGNPDPGPMAIIEEQAFEGYRNLPITFNGFNSLTPAEIPDSDDGIMDLEYSWDFDDDSVIVTGESTPVHTYNEIGTYRVTLTVTDSIGRTSKDDIKIKIIKSKPHARFTATPSYGESELLVEFDASSSSDLDDNIDHYIWKFGNDVTLSTTEAEIVHPFINNTSSPRTYNVVLKVIDEDDLYDTYSLPITVLPKSE